MRGKIRFQIAGPTLLLAGGYFAICDIFEYFQINVVAIERLATIPSIYVSLIGRGVFLYVAEGSK